jgi:hypothetical protein
MTETDISRSRARRRTCLLLIWLGALGLVWLLVSPAHVLPSPAVETSPRDGTRVSCDAVLFAGPSGYLYEDYDGLKNRHQESAEKAATHAACDALRTRRLGWSVLLAIPVTVLLVRLPPAPPSSWGPRTGLEPAPPDRIVHPHGPGI